MAQTLALWMLRGSPRMRGADAGERPRSSSLDRDTDYDYVVVRERQSPACRRAFLICLAGPYERRHRPTRRCPIQLIASLEDEHVRARACGTSSRVAHSWAPACRIALPFISNARLRVLARTGHYVNQSAPWAMPDRYHVRGWWSGGGQLNKSQGLGGCLWKLLLSRPDSESVVGPQGIEPWSMD